MAIMCPPWPCSPVPVMSPVTVTCPSSGHRISPCCCQGFPPHGILSGWPLRMFTDTHLHPVLVVPCVPGVPVREKMGGGLQGLPWGPARQVPELWV